MPKNETEFLSVLYLVSSNLPSLTYSLGELTTELSWQIVAGVQGLMSFSLYMFYDLNMQYIKKVLTSGYVNVKAVG